MTSVRRRLILNQGISIIASGQCGTDAYWSLDVNGKLSITGTGQISSRPWYNDYRGEITYLYIGDGITSASANIFRDLIILDTVDVPNTLTTLGSYCFLSSKPINTVNYRGSIDELFGTQGYWTVNQGFMTTGSSTKQILINGTPLPSTITIGCETIYGTFERIGQSFDKIIIADGVKEISKNFAASPSGYSISRIEIPDSVIKIGDSAFRQGHIYIKINANENLVLGEGLNFYTWSPTYDFSDSRYIPTVANNTFGEYGNSKTIIVPDILYNEWITADVWSQWASKIFKASDYFGG